MRPPRTSLCPPQFKFHQYQVVGRHLPTESEANPTVYRMKVWAQDQVKAKSKFWCVPHPGDRGRRGVGRRRRRAGGGRAN